MTPSVLWMFAIALIIVGLVGIVMPGLPGTILVFAGMCLAAWADGFSRVGMATIALLAVLAAGEFEIVIHPVSTCYLPDVAAVYREVARITAPAGLSKDSWPGAWQWIR